MNIETVSISKVKKNPNNPRILKDDKFKKLCKSIKEFPEMLKIRPIVVNDDMIVLGGNMRLQACKEVGIKKVNIIKASNLTEEQQREFIIKDNVGFGEWDWDVLGNEWNIQQLEDWGLELPINKENKSFDLFDIEIPFYTPSLIEPELEELANTDTTKNLINEIEVLKAPNELKEILKIRASFFTDFNFQKIADYYSRQNKDLKQIFEKLGMVILAPKDALEKGFVEISENIFDL